MPSDCKYTAAQECVPAVVVHSCTVWGFGEDTCRHQALTPAKGGGQADGGQTDGISWVHIHTMRFVLLDD